VAAMILVGVVPTDRIVLDRVAPVRGNYGRAVQPALFAVQKRAQGFGVQVVTHLGEHDEVEIAFRPRLVERVPHQVDLLPAARGAKPPIGVIKRGRGHVRAVGNASHSRLSGYRSWVSAAGAAKRKDFIATARSKAAPAAVPYSWRSARQSYTHGMSGIAEGVRQLPAALVEGHQRSANASLAVNLRVAKLLPGLPS
jgi:hypothetical protein